MNTKLRVKPMTVCAILAIVFSSAAAQSGIGVTAVERKGLAASIGITVSGGASLASNVNSGDRKMMRAIAYANMFQVAMGTFAIERTKSDDVKSFAQKMVNDHTKAQQELQALADGKGVKLPTEPDATHRTMTRMMGALKGDVFDRRYLKQGGVDDHENTRKLLERVQAKAKDTDLQNYAAKTIMAVELHLSLAQAIAGSREMSNPKANMEAAAATTGAGSRGR